MKAKKNLIVNVILGAKGKAGRGRKGGRVTLFVTMT